MPDSTPQKKLKRSTTPKLFQDSGADEPVEVPELESLEQGTLIEGKYKVLSMIGKSELAIVYRVEHIHKQKEFALKLFEPEFSDSQIQRFQNDAKEISVLEHPNIEKLTDFGVIDGKQPYYVSELTDGTTLSDYLSRCGRLTYDDIFGVFIPLAWALQDAHEKGIFHRNVKPSNILLVGEQGNWSCKLLDFATGKLSEGGRKPRAQFIRSNVNPQYVSPEQFTAKKTDQCSDIYSMGCSLFEAITARPPFACTTNEEAKTLHSEGKVPSLKEASLGRDFPDALEHIVLTMLEKDPQRRFSSASQIAENLMRLKLSKQLRIKPKPKRKRDRIFWFALLGAFGAAGLTVLMFSLAQVKETKTHQIQLNVYNSSTSFNSPLTGPSEEEFNREEVDAGRQMFLQSKRNEQGQEFRNYEFPRFRIGILTDPSSKNIEVIGNQTLIWKGPWKFRPIESIFENCPAAIERFGDDELKAIRFNNCSDKFKDVLKDLGRFQYLDELSFESVRLNESDLKKVEKLSGLKSLGILSTTLSPAELSKSPLLRQIEMLKIGEMSDIGALLEALIKSDNLLKLSIRGCELSNRDYRRIASIPNLQSLAIQMSLTIDKKQIENLALAKHLRHLDLQNCHLPHDTIRSLGHLRKLESLTLSRGSVDAEQQSAIQNILPTTRVVMF